MSVSEKVQSGFSLVELLAAVMILSVGLLGLAELQVTSIKANAQSDSVSVANALAQKVIEEVMAKGVSDSSALFSTASTGTAWDGSPFSIPGAGDYNVTYDVVPSYYNVARLSQVTIHVRSASAVSNVLGNRIRGVDAVALKRL